VWIVRLMIYWSEKWSIPKVSKYERYQQIVNKNLSFIIYFLYQTIK